MQRFAYSNHLIFLFLLGLFLFGLGSSGAILMPEPAVDENVGRSTDTAVESAVVSGSPTAAAQTGGAQTAGVELAGADLSDVPLLQDDPLVPAYNPYTYEPPAPNLDLQTYEVERGDTPNRIADRFGIEPSTILGGNGWLSQESSLLQAGVELTILPIDGVLHEVQVGETLESIAEQYGIPVEEIVAYEPNNLEFPYRVQRGSEIIIPGAVRELFVWTPPKLSNRQGANRVVGTGTFVMPVGGGCVTQYFLPWHPGLDIGLQTGTAVYAMDRGTVSYASWAAGSYYDYGNLVVIDHGNGYETFYAHLSQINVFPGQVVEQGQYIAGSGNTGRSSGPHLHVEIRLNNYRDDPSFYIQGSYPGCAY